MPLEDDLQQFAVNQKSEMEGVAEQIFEDKETDGMSSIDMKTNISDEEIGLCLVNDLIFNQLGLKELSPTRQFKRLASSRQGWKTESFVKTTQGINEMQSHRGLRDRLGNLFSRKDVL